MNATLERRQLTHSERQQIQDSATLRAWSDMLVADLKDGTLDSTFLLAMAEAMRRVSKRLFDSVEV